MPENADSQRDASKVNNTKGRKHHVLNVWLHQHVSLTKPHGNGGGIFHQHLLYLLICLHPLLGVLLYPGLVQ